MDDKDIVKRMAALRDSTTEAVEEHLADMHVNSLVQRVENEDKIKKITKRAIRKRFFGGIVDEINQRFLKLANISSDSIDSIVNKEIELMVDIYREYKKPGHSGIKSGLEIARELEKKEKMSKVEAIGIAVDKMDVSLILKQEIDAFNTGAAKLKARLDELIAGKVKQSSDTRNITRSFNSSQPHEEKVEGMSWWSLFPLNCCLPSREIQREEQEIEMERMPQA